MVIQQATSATLTKEVLYIGSAVPLETAEGLEAVQQPLRSRYPIDTDENVQGILSVLSILPSGIQLRYKNDPSYVVLFPYSALIMCAAVRSVKTINKVTHEVSARFVSLSSPEANGANNRQPAIFTAITRRTKGRQVLECHGFITMSPQDALELVQWTSTLDKRSKQEGLDTGAEASSSSFDLTRGDTSFYTETGSLPESPIQLVPGQPVIQSLPSASYKEPPLDGYFYSTKTAQAKKYSLQKFSGNTVADDTASIIGQRADHFDRSGYAASHYSASAAMYPTRPRQPIFVPVRSYHPPPLVRPMFVGRPPPLLSYPRPHFFSPPPVMRARPVPIFVPPPVPTVYAPPPVPTVYVDNVHARSKISRHVSRESLQSSSTASLPDSPHINGRHHGKLPHNHSHDASSESISRPHTPPTDYDIPRGPHISRREDYTLRKTVSRDHLESPSVVSVKDYKGGYYVVPTYGYYGPAGATHRPQSVPSYVERNGTKTKNKKPKKNKKDQKKSHKKSSQGKQDKSTDSAGYMSELTPNGDSKQPRDFRRAENQFTHERAFSKSLAEETRHSDRGDNSLNAYSLNHTARNNENEFPPSMY